MNTDTEVAGALDRVARLTGRDGLDRLAAARVIVFGLGGVGSWAAEALARTGVGHLTLVDADTVALSNINRQLPAAMSTLGRAKTEVMARRLADVAPGCCVEVRTERYCAGTSDSFCLESYDAVIDAIDSLADKASLILEATACPLPTRLFSSMGAALRTKPWMVATAEFWNVEGDALAAALRRRFRKAATMPRRKFKCVYSPEQGRNLWQGPDLSAPMTFGKQAVNGAMMAVTATFGMCLAALATEHILSLPNPRG